MAAFQTEADGGKGLPYPPQPPRFVTVSGDTVRVEAPGYDLTKPWFGSFRLRVRPPYPRGAPGLQNRGLMVGPVGSTGLLIERLLRGRVTEELSAQGGRILIARGDFEDRGLVVWRGRWHEVYGWANEPGTSSGQMLRLFDRLTLADSPEGLRVHLDPVPAETIHFEEVVKRVPDVGILHIRRGAEAAELVPEWSGTPVPSGEVWQQRGTVQGGQAVRLYVHASRTAVTTLAPDRQAGVPDGRRLRFLQALTEISWQ